jgi:hypothetical protein
MSDKRFEISILSFGDRCIRERKSCRIVSCPIGTMRVHDRKMRVKNIEELNDHISKRRQG